MWTDPCAGAGSCWSWWGRCWERLSASHWGWSWTIPGAGTAGVAQAPDRGAVVAAGATGSQPPTSGTVGTGSDGPADRPGKARAKDRDKSDKARSEGRGKDKPGKDKRDDKKSERD
jgi:hypothetical protein